MSLSVETSPREFDRSRLGARPGRNRGANRLVYFDITDFDEAALAPASWEVARCATSLLLAAADLRLERAASERLVRAYLDAYAAALAKGKALWVERATATGMVRKLLRAGSCP